MGALGAPQWQTKGLDHAALSRHGGSLRTHTGPQPELTETEAKLSQRMFRARDKWDVCNTLHGKHLRARRHGGQRTKLDDGPLCGRTGK